jgi:histidinol-phosphate aminotransferase
MCKVKDSYNVNRLAIVAGVAALEDLATMHAHVARIRLERERMTAALLAMGFCVYPSKANFVAVRTQGPAPMAIRETLAERGILVRTYGEPLLADWVRISIGTPEQNDEILDVIRGMTRGAGAGAGDE